MTDNSRPMASFLKHLKPRNIWRNHLLYNKTGIAVLTAMNKIRWPHMDITLIVWPPARSFFEDIERDIRKEYRIVQSDLYRIEEGVFEDFVRKVYDIDSASQYKISYKLENLIRPPLDIQVIKVRFPWPNMEVQDLLNRVRCKDVHVLKESIRSEYKKKIDDYVFDIIIHSTETAQQGIHVEKLLKQYGNKIPAAND